MQFSTTKKPFIGELRLTQNRRSMCVLADARFGGGSGDVWVTEGKRYHFTVAGSLDYYRGQCQVVDPVNKTIVMTITDGDTWGRYALGHDANVNCESIVHLYEMKSHSHDLIDESKKAALRARAEAALAAVSMSELREAIKSEHEGYLQELIGEDSFKTIKVLVTEFVHLSKAVDPAGINGYRAPSSHVFEHKHKLLSQLKRLREGGRND
ncbi:hypothetical protein N9J40_01355 [Burkholderiaceae bacterium]|nr:hypothetical protein [Burkholderiaceae bacterium]